MKLNINSNMRRGIIIGIVVVLLVLVVLIGIKIVKSSKGIENPIDQNEVIGREIKELQEFKNIELDRVVKASVVHSGEAGIIKLDISDKKRIKKLYNDIGSLKLSEVTDLIVMDASESYVFEYEDGTRISLYFEAGIFVHDGVRYITEGIVDESDLDFMVDVK